MLRWTQPGHPLVSRHNEYHWKLGHKQAHWHTARCTSHISMVQQCKLVSSSGLRKWTSTPLYEPRAQEELVSIHYWCISTLLRYVESIYNYNKMVCHIRDLYILASLFGTPETQFCILERNAGDVFIPNILCWIPPLWWQLSTLWVVDWRMQYWDTHFTTLMHTQPTYHSLSSVYHGHHWLPIPSLCGKAPTVSK